MKPKAFYDLTRRRAEFLLRTRYPKELLDLEADCGEVLLSYLDIEPIQPNDPEKFKWWFDTHSQPVSKLKDDVAAKVPKDGTLLPPLFRSISTQPTVSQIWQENVRSDTFIQFPELIEKIMQMPFRKMPRVLFWSSMREVKWHRDEWAYQDFPSSFRCMMVDENSSPTLKIAEDPTDGTGRQSPQCIDTSISTSFVWNNLRAAHASDYTGKRKILLILNTDSHNIDVIKYRKLLERSLCANHAVLGKFSRDSFCSV